MLASLVLSLINNTWGILSKEFSVKAPYKKRFSVTILLSSSHHSLFLLLLSMGGEMVRLWSRSSLFLSSRSSFFFLAGKIGSWKEKIMMLNHFHIFFCYNHPNSMNSFVALSGIFFFLIVQRLLLLEIEKDLSK